MMGGLEVLIQHWLDETSIYSDPRKCLEVPSFDTLQKYDHNKVVTALLDKLEKEPTIQIMVALGKLTGENPVSPEHRGMIKEMAKDWLNWRG